MSAFECREGHEIVPGRDKGRCPICGERAYMMDGKTNRELRWEEEQDRETDEQDVCGEEGGDKE